MSNASDFVIQNGVLKRYTGSGGNISVPNGGKTISQGAFAECAAMTSVSLPEGLKNIGNFALSTVRD